MASSSDALVDFSKLPSSALDNYITYFDLAKAYPPPPTKRQRRTETPSSEREGSALGAEGETDEERASKRIDSAQTITTSTRLRPRSPTASMAHFFPGSTGKRNSTAAEDELMQSGGQGVAEGNGRDDEAPCPSHFFDVQEADSYLASLASRHFVSQPPPKEGEVVVQFLYRCRAGGEWSVGRQGSVAGP